MGIAQTALAAAIALAGLFVLAKLFSAPLRLAVRLAVNTALAFALLGLLHATGLLARLSLGMNLFNALVIAVLGVPGVGLLVLLRTVFL